MATAIITRKQAREAGLSRYFTGVPCKNGHVEDRSVAGAHCMECARIINRKTKRRWRANNPELHKSRLREWAKKNPDKVKENGRRWSAENPEKSKRLMAERGKRWRESNPEKHRAAVDRWQARNRQQTLEINRRWRRNNPEKVLTQGRIRRARKRGAPGRHCAKDIEQIVKAQRGKCAWCCIELNRVQRHVDHVMPLTLGGSNDKTNLQVLCRPCNLSKGAKHPMDFARLEGRLL